MEMKAQSVINRWQLILRWVTCLAAPCECHKLLLCLVDSSYYSAMNVWTQCDSTNNRQTSATGSVQPHNKHRQVTSAAATNHSSPQLQSTTHPPHFTPVNQIMSTAAAATTSTAVFHVESAGSPSLLFHHYLLKKSCGNKWHRFSQGRYILPVTQPPASNQCIEENSQHWSQTQRTND